MMYTNVIVGVDGQDGGLRASALARSLAAPDARLTLVFVCRQDVNLKHALELEAATDRSIADLLERELSICGRGSWIKRVTAESVGAGLEAVAADCDADLIVVGSSSRHGLARLRAGDDVKSVMHQTPSAVAIAPASCAGRPNVFARIGVAYDGSRESEVALAHAGLLAAGRNAELIIRQVQAPRVYAVGLTAMTAPVSSPTLAVAAAGEPATVPEGLPVETVCGEPRPELVAFSASVQLLVCGSRRKGLMKRIAAGSMSDYLARHSAAPLIVAPSTDTPSVERWLAQRSTVVV
jgi:nucleotide-binding universal stress UspA family protein